MKERGEEGEKGRLVLSCLSEKLGKKGKSQKQDIAQGKRNKEGKGRGKGP